MRKNLSQKLQKPGMSFGRVGAPAAISALLLAIVAVVCFLAPWLAPHSPTAQDFTTGPPSAENPFGVDKIGRDILSRLMYGGRISLVIGLAATALALILGATLGAIAATSKKAVDEVIMRVLDVIMAFPGIALAAVLVAVSPKEIRLGMLIVAIAVVYMPQIARVVRANVAAQYGEDYVDAEKVIGAKPLRIVVRHVAVNCAAPVLVFCTLLVADAIVFEAGLSFIGAGMPPEVPTWGGVLAEGKDTILIGQWWSTLFAGLMIFITVLTLNILAEGITDALANPSLRKIKVQTSAGQIVETVEIEDIETVVEQAQEDVPLQIHLAALRRKELSRNDRLVYQGDAEPLLEVRNLSIRFPERYGDIAIVDNVSFTVRPNETMGLVGESGCGKSLTSLAIMGLLPESAMVSGEILFDGVDLLKLNPRERNKLRGHEMSMIYQDALSSLNPSMTVKNQLGQMIKRGGTRSAEELLTMVGLDPQRTLSSYPHELSGGQRQRVLIAMALTRSPKLVVADEPTTALDVTVQKQVIDLLNNLREQLGFAMVFVSHDLALVASLAHKVTVMYAGQLVETGPTVAVLSNPRHEYTQGLLGSVLSIEDGAERLHQISGAVPSPHDFTTGDRFAGRAADQRADSVTRPVMVDAGGNHQFASNRLDLVSAVRTDADLILAGSEED
ncbi:ABC transporter [Arthrobacter psychrolactophilus]|uniref:ABC transporter n=1 Tax=Arthrobacter psychrolactophilus TaxID=92442 RepID=A0A2V5IVH8_9MICC|nr:dipeptide/oligopeptide/nickel ABC transporter permease/ATP-binding protein [Arthrobacter psychrolactophilus]PYI39412.1 ABC transporter [Arthrobacter psychrolactophilus]